MVRYRRKRTYRRYTVRRRRPTRRTYQKTPKQLHYALAPQPQIVGSAANIYSAGTLYQFYWVGQGAGIDARLGNKILPVSVLFRGVLTQAGTQQQVVRVLISRSRAGVLTSTDFPSANPWICRIMTKCKFCMINGFILLRRQLLVIRQYRNSYGFIRSFEPQSRLSLMILQYSLLMGRFICGLFLMHQVLVVILLSKDKVCRLGIMLSK